MSKIVNPSIIYRTQELQDTEKSLVRQQIKAVEAIAGKGLSTNDYTPEEKLKLANITSNAEANTINSISLNDTTLTPDDKKNVNISISAAGIGAATADHTHTAAEVGAATANHTHTAADVGAAAANHTHTAAEVGAAATDHTHTYSDVGAASAKHTHTATEVGAATADHTHTAAEVGAATADHTHTAAEVGAATADHTHTYSEVGAASATHTHTAADVGAAATDHTHTYSEVGAAAANHTHTAADVGAAAANHTHTAAEVGAAATDHTHTAAEVGAATADHTHTAAEVGAATANHTHTAADVGAAAANHTHTAAEVGAATADHTHTYSEVGAASATHTHTAADVGAATAVHTHEISDVNGLSAALSSAENVIEAITVNGVAQPITEKTVAITVSAEGSYTKGDGISISDQKVISVDAGKGLDFDADDKLIVDADITDAVENAHTLAYSNGVVIEDNAETKTTTIKLEDELYNKVATPIELAAGTNVTLDTTSEPGKIKINATGGGGISSVVTDGTTILGDGTTDNKIRLAASTLEIDGVTNEISVTPTETKLNIGLASAVTTELSSSKTFREGIDSTIESKVNGMKASTISSSDTGLATADLVAGAIGESLPVTEGDGIKLSQASVTSPLTISMEIPIVIELDPDSFTPTNDGKLHFVVMKTE